MKTTYIIIIIIVAVITIAPIYYFTFRVKKSSDNLNIYEGNYSTRRILTLLDKKSKVICVNNVKMKIKNKKIVFLPGLILSRNNIFLLISINKKFKFDDFQKYILDNFWLKSKEHFPLKVVIYNSNFFLNRKINLLEDKVFKIKNYKEMIKLINNWDDSKNTKILDFKSIKEIMSKTIIINKEG